MNEESRPATRLPDDHPAAEHSRVDLAIKRVCLELADQTGRSLLAADIERLRRELQERAAPDLQGAA